MRRPALVVGLAVIALLLGAIGVLYAYGTPQAGSTAIPDPAAAPAGQWAEVADEDPGAAGGAGGEAPPASEQPATSESPASRGEVPEPDPNSPLAISIPGCKCHSDDPKLVKEHEGYRMNQCAGCHAGQVPTGQ